MNTITIYAPRWHDRKVLIAKYRVQTMNRLNVTSKDKFKQHRFPIVEKSGAFISQYPIEQMQTRNGNWIDMYVIPLDDLYPVFNKRGLEKEEIKEVKQGSMF